MPLNDDQGRCALDVVIQGVLDAAVSEGLIVMGEPRAVIHEPTAEDRASRRLSVDLVWDQPPYTVAKGREHELRDRLQTAIAAHMGPRADV